MAEFDISTQQGREKAAHEALSDKAILEELIDLLSGSSRTKRQRAATVIDLVASENPEILKPYVDDIADALNRPEAQTRWETLNTLERLGKAGMKYDDEVLAGAEDALYDEKSGIVREAAFRFLTGYGSVSASNSNKVWSLIDEAIQCYHGNPEFNDMLVALVEFAQSKISKTTSNALAERMRFDSQNASGTLRMRSEQIIAANEARK